MPQDSDDVHGIFDHLDTNRDGKLDRHEIKVLPTTPGILDLLTAISLSTLP